MSTISNRFSNLIALAVPAAGILTCGQAQAAADFFLKFEGIEGESRVTGYEKHIEILSWSSTLNIGTVTGGGGAGKATFKEFTITKKVSSASPPLMLACATGVHFPKATLRLTKPNPAGGPEDYYIVTLTDVVVSSYSSSRPAPTAAAPTTTDNAPVESLSLNFTKIEFEYRPAPFNGQVLPPVTAIIDVAR